MSKSIRDADLGELRPRERAFLKAYLDDTNKETFLNASACYRYTHPKAKKGTAWVEASRFLSNPRVRAVLDQTMPDKEDIERYFLMLRDRALESGDLARAESCTVNYGKFRQYLIEKQEVRTIDDQARDRLSALARGERGDN